MKNLGLHTIETSAIVAGTDFAAKAELPVISALIHELRTADDPDSKMLPMVVRRRDNRILAGEDVLAAHVAIQSPTVRALLVDLDEDEATALRTADEARIMCGQLTERDAIFALVALVTEKLTQAAADASRTDASETPAIAALKRGRKGTNKARARAIVAELLGTTPEALRKAEARHAALQAQGQVAAPEEWRLQCYGNVATAALLADARAIHTALAHVDTYLRSAQRELTRVQDTRLGSARYERGHAAARNAAVLVRGFMPSHLCPYCKDVARVRSVCSACWSSGYVGPAEFAEAPERLKSYPCVSFGGAYVDPVTLRPYRFPSESNENVGAFEAGYIEYDEEQPEVYLTAAEPELANEEPVVHCDDEPEPYIPRDLPIDDDEML